MTIRKYTQVIQVPAGEKVSIIAPTPVSWTRYQDGCTLVTGGRTLEVKADTIAVVNAKDRSFAWSALLIPHLNGPVEIELVDSTDCLTDTERLARFVAQELVHGTPPVLEFDNVLANNSSSLTIQNWMEFGGLVDAAHRLGLEVKSTYGDHSILMHHLDQPTFFNILKELRTQGATSCNWALSLVDHGKLYQRLYELFELERPLEFEFRDPVFVIVDSYGRPAATSASEVAELLSTISSEFGYENCVRDRSGQEVNILGYMEPGTFVTITHGGVK